MNKQKHTALIITADQFEDMEVMYPLFRLQEAGWRVDLAAPKAEEINGEFGNGTLIPTITLNNANPDNYDLLMVPGGSPDGAPTTIRNSKRAKEIVQSFFAENKLVASICHGSWTLADSGVLKGRHLTTYWHDGVPEDVKKVGGIWEDKDVVIDGNLITSRWPADLPVFMRAVMERFDK
jgi:protease I